MRSGWSVILAVLMSGVDTESELDSTARLAKSSNICLYTIREQILFGTYIFRPCMFTDLIVGEETLNRMV